MLNYALTLTNLIFFKGKARRAEKPTLHKNILGVIKRSKEEEV